MLEGLVINTAQEEVTKKEILASDKQTYWRVWVVRIETCKYSQRIEVLERVVGCRESS